ncbi:MAG: hypothetical protein ACYCPF_22205, partial [Streptosporangiaceae bacterium]
RPQPDTMSATAAAWSAVLLSALLLTATLIGVVWRGGRRDGKLDAILEELRRIGVDHEERIRKLEQSGRP